ncbi:MAG: hypothetical protein GXO73_06915 [Calditrichaeota bacterium]|nr:hypothetical protein [Calditrichota bacterium]
MAFTAYGLHIGIRVSDAVVLPRLPELLPFGWQPSKDPEVEYLYSFIVGNTAATTGVKRLHVVYSDAIRLERTDDLEIALKALERDLHLFVGEMARGRVFVHAGVVGWKGKAIILPGPSFTGKSTLVAALVRAGATYYSDEFAILDECGLVHPFARPLSLRCADPYVGEPVGVEELGGEAGTQPLPVGMIVTTTYREGGTWLPTTLSQGKAVLALLSNTLSARRQPEVVLPVLEIVAAGARAISSTRGEADDIVAQLLATDWKGN